MSFVGGSCRVAPCPPLLKTLPKFHWGLFSTPLLACTAGCPLAEPPARSSGLWWSYCGRAEVFFDDTQIEVSGPSFEGARINYEGNLALGWQTLWWGPFLLEAHLDSPGDVSSALPAMLERHQGLWKERASEFLADSGSSAGVYLNAIGKAGFTHW